MLNMAVRNTNKLVRAHTKSDKVRLGRYFTKKDTARTMAGMLTLPDKPVVSVLDAGAGTGILSAAAVEALCTAGQCREIHLTAYENNALFLPVLRDNLERIRRRARRLYGVKLIPEVIEENFVLAGREAYTLSLSAREPRLWDLILTNPPAERIAPDAPEALCVPDLFAGAVDLSYLFLAVADSLLAPGGSLVACLPTAFATAPGLSKLRNSLFSVNTPTSLHLFTTGSATKPLKKTMLLALHHTPPVKGDMLQMSSSTDHGTPEATTRLEPLPVSFAVRGEDKSLLLLYDPAELLVYRYMTSQKSSFSAMHLSMHTGLTLPSRYRKCLYDAPEAGLVPLLTPAGLSEGRVMFPVTEKGTRVPLPGQYLMPLIPSLVQKNRNLLLIKRMPARSDKRRLVTGVYFSSQMSHCKYVSTHNKLNYVDRDGDEMDASLLLGLHCFLSSGVCDLYVRMISKSHQINARELADLPLPETDVLRRLGVRLIAAHDFTPEYCDRVIHEVLHISVKR